MSPDHDPGVPPPAAGPDEPRHPWPGQLEPPTIPSSPDASVPFRSVGFTISTLGYEIARRFREMLQPLELEPREFALLRAVGADEGRSQQAVGARLKIAPSRMVGFVDALEARGLLERRLNAEDRRTRALHLTEVGRELLGRAFALAVSHERDLCGELEGPERDQLLDLLGKVGVGLGVPPGVHSAHGHSALADE
jgi:DNA-binding MarR family transcriptional regulator